MARKLRRSKNGTASESDTSTPSPAGEAKKRGRPKLAVMPMANVSDETIREAVSKAIALKSKVDSAQGEYRAHLKACRNVGLEPGDVSHFIRIRTRDVAEIDQETKRRTRLAMVMGLPIGSQLGLFDDGESAATKAEASIVAKHQASASTDKTIAAARAKGYDDGSEGKSRADVYEDGSPEQLAYDAAWQEAQRALAQKTFGGVAEQTAPN